MATFGVFFPSHLNERIYAYRNAVAISVEKKGLKIRSLHPLIADSPPEHVDISNNLDWGR